MSVSEQNKLGVTPNSTEQKAIECFKALEKAEDELNDVGLEFGRAVIEIRDEIRENKDRNFLTRLEELGISRDKARYWINKVEGKPTDRRKKEMAEPAELDWETVVARFKPLADDIIRLKRREPLQGGDIVGKLSSLADAFGYELRKKGENDA